MGPLLQKAKLVRKWSMVSTTEAGSGHPTSCLSAADLMTVLFDKYYHYDLSNPLAISNDRLIFSKGHAAPLFYTLYALAGAFPIEELKTLRKFSSRLEGHPTPEFPFTEAATGSLGQGLSVGAGLAIAQLRDNQLITKPHVFVLLGDGEMAEGQVWEAANFASNHKINNLVAIVDTNRLGQSQETMFGHNADEYVKRFEAFGWKTISIDGHDIAQIDKAFLKAISNQAEKPFVIIAKTDKGHGISFLSNQENWHGKPLSKDLLEKALLELGELKDEAVFALQKPKSIVLNNIEKVVVNDINIDYKLGDLIATREIYGKTLVEIGNKNENIVALDAEVKNSTYSIDFLKVFPDRFFECFIAEQNMVSVAAGLSRFGKVPFVSTFAAFFTRAFDQIRMAWLSGANIKFVGSHAGVSIGEDGASQMGLEEIAMFGTLPDTVIVQPCDAVSASKLLLEIASTQGIAYLQTLRSKTPVIYSNNDDFKIGGSKILKQSDKDTLTIAATGITVFEALKAYEALKLENIFVKVIDCYSVSPIDKTTLIASVKSTKYPVLITVEDHFIHGGLGDFAMSALSDQLIRVEKIAVKKHSHSGNMGELLNDAGISSVQIIEKVKTQLQSVA